MAQHTQIKSGLAQAFDIKKDEVISLVGGGGKSSLMQALADELAAAGGTVVTTTTTKIFEYQSPSGCLIVEADEDKMLALMLEALQKHRHVTLARARLTENGKLDGISPQTIERIAALKKVDYIIIEADGAARKPLKAPNATEPVIADNTSLVIAVAGIEALGKELNKDNAFRPEIISEITGLPVNEKITAAAFAALLTDERGITKGSPKNARIVPFINKVDSEKELEQAEEVAQKIMEAGKPNIECVVLGKLQSAAPVIKIIKPAQG